MWALRQEENIVINLGGKGEKGRKVMDWTVHRIRSTGKHF